jgi:hypothetical protein
MQLTVNGQIYAVPDTPGRLVTLRGVAFRSTILRMAWARAWPGVRRFMGISFLTRSLTHPVFTPGSCQDWRSNRFLKD